MAEHFCQIIVDWHTEPGEDGDPIFCDKPASIKQGQEWLCAEHYDEIIRQVKLAVDKAADS